MTTPQHPPHRHQLLRMLSMMLCLSSLLAVLHGLVPEVQPWDMPLVVPLMLAFLVVAVTLTDLLLRMHVVRTTARFALQEIEDHRNEFLKLTENCMDLHINKNLHLAPLENMKSTYLEWLAFKNALFIDPRAVLRGLQMDTLKMQAFLDLHHQKVKTTPTPTPAWQIKRSLLLLQQTHVPLFLEAHGLPKLDAFLQEQPELPSLHEVQWTCRPTGTPFHGLVAFTLRVLAAGASSPNADWVIQVAVQPAGHERTSQYTVQVHPERLQETMYT